MVQLKPPGEPRGLVLFSYVAESVVVPYGTDLPGHSNRWESREIAYAIASLGYVVEVVDWDNQNFWPREPFDAIFDINLNLQRLAPLMPRAKRLLHFTESYGRFNNAAELARVEAFEAKTGRLYAPKRLSANIDLTERSLRLADRCTLIGNADTLATFPEAVQAKTTLVPVTASPLPHIRPPEEMPPPGREFLWFFGYGAVHKGLDLVLDVLRRRTDLTLHIAGPVHLEQDFIVAYRDVLQQPNVHLHGYVDTSSPTFADMLKNVFCFVAPTCAEGTSPSVVTCLQYGLYPILSRHTGVDVPEGCGLVLDRLDEASVEAAMDAALAMDAVHLREETRRCQAFALATHARDTFSRRMRAYLAEALA